MKKIILIAAAIFILLRIFYTKQLITGDLAENSTILVTYSKNNNSFYIDSKEEIKAFSKQLRLHPVFIAENFIKYSKDFPCDARISVLQNGHIIQEIELDLTGNCCKDSNSSVYKISRNFMKEITAKLKKAEYKETEYNDIETARKEFSNYKQNSAVVYLKPAEWEKHDGYFAFKIEEKDKKDLQPQKIIETVTAKYKQQEEAFEIKQMWLYDTAKQSYGYTFYVFCSKNFYEKFDDFQKEEYHPFFSKNNPPKIAYYSKLY